jgi:hypothetical protein
MATLMTFMSSYLLDYPFVTCYTTWPDGTPGQNYLDSRVYDGVNITWKQLIKQVSLPSAMYGYEENLKQV